jgi:hypothetical protein
MLFEMGERRPKGAAAWLDPFAAYRISEKADAPTPVRPTEGKSAWREFAALFLQVPPHSGSPGIKRAADKQSRILAQILASPAGKTIRPALLDQIAELKFGSGRPTHPFRCIGIRTDKAKCFEWIDAWFDVPPALLNDPAGALRVDQALRLANQCEQVISRAFGIVFGGSAKAARHDSLKRRMADSYWAALAEPFRGFILNLATGDQEAAFKAWRDAAIRQARISFSEAAAQAGEDADALMHQAQGERLCNSWLYVVRKEYEADE